MKKQKTAPAESAVQTEKKGTGIQIDKKTVFGITALLLVIMLLAGVLKYIMSSVVRKFEKKKYLLLAVIVFVCMMMSSVVGVLEESLTLVPLAVAISLALGWDSFVGLGISMVSIAFGYTAATFNPCACIGRTAALLPTCPCTTWLWIEMMEVVMGIVRGVTWRLPR